MQFYYTMSILSMFYLISFKLPKRFLHQKLSPYEEPLDYLGGKSDAMLNGEDFFQIFFVQNLLSVAQMMTTGHFIMGWPNQRAVF